MMKQRLNQLPLHTYDTWSSMIANNLFQQSVWKQAKTIGITISVGKEINTRTIIERAWLEGKNVAVPQTKWKSREMRFRLFSDYDQLEKVKFDLYEPKESLTSCIDHEEIDLLIVPGLCFDENGYRLGYGGGFYDRFLANFNSYTISLAFPFQYLRWLPRDKYDLQIHMLITPTKVIKYE
jgi:5-formyltetrahydrofolate cyclo-ligase